MQHAVMRAAEAVILEQAVGVADEIAIGEEEQLDEIDHRLALDLGRARAVGGNGASRRTSLRSTTVFTSTSALS